MPENTSLPTAEEIAALPRWARVAFAARCARRVLPRAVQYRRDSKYCQTLLNAVVAVEASASRAVVAVIADDFVQLARTSSESGLRAVVAAVYTADARADAVYAANAAIAAAEYGGRNVVMAVRFDYSTLRERSDSEAWTDDTPVPPTVFGPMWPYGVRSSWPEEVDTARLKLTITPPKGATPDQMAEFQRQLVRVLDRLAIANGGTGLTIVPPDAGGTAAPAKPGA